MPFSIASRSSGRRKGLIINLKLNLEQLIKAARPGAKVDNASLEKKPIMQSVFSDMRKVGMSTSSEKRSFGKKYIGLRSLSD